MSDIIVEFTNKALTHIVNVIPNKPNWTDVAVIIGTFLLVLTNIALVFRSEFIKWLYLHSKLNLKIKNYSPYCVKVPSGYVNNEFKPNSYYLRFRVINDGKARAKDVEILVEKLHKYNKIAKEFQEIKEFLPLNLIWSNSKPTTDIMKVIYPKASRFCDLGHVMLTKEAKETPAINSFLKTKSSIIFLFDVMDPSTTLSHIIEPGKYKIRLSISSSDTNKPIKKDFEMEIPSMWEFNEKNKLKGLKIEPC